jgi:hypothetical protein
MAHESIDESLNLFNRAINEASHHTLKPNRVPNPRGIRWWNDTCSVAHTLVWTAPAGRQRYLAARNLQNTVAKAKRVWAHEQLNEAVDAQDIWRLAKARKGHHTNLFPLLRNADNILIDNLELKADIFHSKFFPGEPRQVPIHHDTDHAPIQPREWAPITTEDVSAALRTTTNWSAPGPSGIGYKLLKWAHTANPTAIPDLLDRCLREGIHPWKKATVVVINKPQKPDYSIPKVYRPIALMECVGKLLEKIITKRINANIERFNLLPMTQFGSRPHHSTIDAVATLVHKI